ASYRAHPAGATVQYLLVEGLAGLLLGIVLACVLRAVRDRVGGRATGPAALSAIAVITSLSQCVIGLFAVAAATSGNAALCGSLSDLVNRLDGVKMLALAAAAAWVARLRLRLPHAVERAGLDRLRLRPAAAAVGSRHGRRAQRSSAAIWPRYQL